MSEAKSVHILLCGHYYRGNTGDDLLMDYIVSSLKKYGEVRVTNSFTPEQVAWCDMVVIGGGSLTSPRSIGGHDFAVYAKQTGKKVFIYSQTIEEGHPKLKEHLVLADFITVRDSTSKKIVEDNGFRAIVTSDPVFDKKRRVIGFSFRRWYKEPAGIEDRLSSMLDELSVDFDIISMPYSLNEEGTESDLIFHEKIMQRMKREPIKTSFDESLDKIDLLISMRLHALIVTINKGKKVIAIDYDAKVGRILSDLSLDDMVVTYEDIEKIPVMLREKVFKSDFMSMKKMVNEAVMQRLCDDINGRPAPRISVVMHIYSSSPYLKEVIDSIIGQTVQDWELIIIDEESQSNTMEIVNSCHDDRVRYFNFGRNGMGYARNAGNLLSRGDIIIVADPGYINHPNRLEIIRGLIEDKKADIVYSSMTRTFGEQKAELIKSEPFSDERLKKGNFLYHPTLAYQRRVAISCPYNEDKDVMTDYSFYLLAAEKGYKFMRSEDPLVIKKCSERGREAIELEKAPMVSVIIPTCNRREFIKAALESVISQTYRNLEVIVVNDGGVDISDIIYPLNSEGRIVYLEHQDKKGPSAARNTGLKAARGRYVAYLDDDDIYYPEHLETLVVFLEGSSKYKVAYTDSYQVFQTRLDDKYIAVGKQVTYSHDFDPQKFLISNHVHIINIMHRRDILDEIGMFDETLETHEDFDLCIRLSMVSDFYHIKKITAEFRTRDDMTNTITFKKEAFLGSLKMVQQRYAHMVNSHGILEEQKKAVKFLEREIEVRNLLSVAGNYENLHRYRFAKELVAGKKILVFDSSGSFCSGYGCSILSETAGEVVCVLPERLAEQVSLRYITKNLQFITQDVLAHHARQFDVIVCFGDDLEALKLAGGSRGFLATDGLLICGGTISFLRKLNDILSNFKNTFIYGQNTHPASNIFPIFRGESNIMDFPIEKSENVFRFVTHESRAFNSFIAVASNVLPEELPGGSYLTDTSDTLLRAFALQKEHLDDIITDRECNANNLKGIVRERDAYIKSLESELSSRDESVRERDAYIKSLESELSSRDESVRERDAYIKSLESELSSRDLSIRRIEDELKVRDNTVMALESEAVRLNMEQYMIRNSFTWRTVMKFQGIMGGVTPSGSKRKFWYDSLLRKLNRKERPAISNSPMPEPREYGHAAEAVRADSGRCRSCRIDADVLMEKVSKYIKANPGSVIVLNYSPLIKAANGDRTDGQ